MSELLGTILLAFVLIWLGALVVGLILAIVINVAYQWRNR